MAEREADARRVLGGSTLDVVKNAKVFMCGAGGIGCELLKCLILAGFRNIDIIDMDTVDSSNLNRQFLFRAEHVDKPKSYVARDTAARYHPDVKINSLYGNVKDAAYDVDFFSKFNIIVNGLDNRSARSHVNRMAMKAGVPLIESGTMGYNGQVQPIIKDTTQCYDCNPKQTGQISFAVCTIHQKPSSMVHCTHYAKEFYKRFFGEAVDADPELAHLSQLLPSGEGAAGQATPDHVKGIFDAIFHGKIEELIQLKSAGGDAAGSGYTDSNRPRPLSFAACVEAEDTAEEVMESQQKFESQRVLSLKQLAEMFVSVFGQLLERVRASGKKAWDKDDDLGMKLVVATANLRAYNFRIKRDSEFSIKSIAGNIIPAIATSNAVISGGIVLEAIKVLTKQHSKVRLQSLRRFPARIKRKDCYIVPEAPPALNPNCYVCQAGTNLLSLRLNLQKTPIRFVVQNICGHELAMPHPMVSLVKGEEEKLVYEDEEMTQNESRPLSDFVDLAADVSEGGRVGWSLALEDMVQELSAEVVLTHDPTLDPADYTLSGSRPEEKKPAAGAAGAGGAGGAAAPVEEDGDDDGVVVFHPRKAKASAADASAAAAGKRNAVDVDGGGSSGQPQQKRNRTDS